MVTEVAKEKDRCREKEKALKKEDEELTKTFANLMVAVQQVQKLATV